MPVPYIDDFGCLITPAQPAVPGAPGVPARVDMVDQFGWESSADSVVTLGGDLRATCQIGQAVGIVFGLAYPPNQPGENFDVLHGLYFFTLNGAELVQAIERGVQVGPVIERASGATFLIQRYRNTVTYWQDTELLYTSARLSTGPQRLAAHLYASSDRIIDALFENIEPGDTVLGQARMELLPSPGTISIRYATTGFDLIDGAADVEFITQALGFGGFDTAPAVADALVSAFTTNMDLRPDPADILIRSGAMPTPAVVGMMLDDPGADIEFVTQGLGTAEFDLEPSPGDLQFYYPFPGLFDLAPSPGDIVVMTVPPPDVFLSLTRQGYAYMVLWAGNDHAVLGDTMQLGDEFRVAALIHRLRERLGMLGTLESLLRGVDRVGERLAMQEALGIIWRVVVREALALDWSLGQTVNVLRTVRDQLVLANIVETTRQANAAIATALTFGNSMRLGWHHGLADVLRMTGTEASRLAAINRMLNQLEMGDSVSPMVTFAALLRDNVVFTHAQTGMLDAAVLLRESMRFMVRIRIDGRTFEAWVINTQSKGVSRYTNYPFNSFMQLPGGEWLGLTDTGLYELDGDDDDGTPIEASIRLALTDFGSRKAKRMPEMHVAVRTNGELVFKTITTSHEGQRVEDWFRFQMGRATEVREGRAKIARGLASVFWGGTLVNVNGADFQLEKLEWRPMSLSASMI